MTTSCNYPVLEGISVNTDSQDIRRHRAMVLELILAEVKESETINRLAAEYGVVGSRFSPLEGALQRRDDCILCGLCARVCSEVIRVCALSFCGRGDKRNIGGSFMEKPEACVGCGTCVSLCPTGCIQMEDRGGVRTVWGREFELVPCDTCGEPLMTEEYRDLALQQCDLDEAYYTTCGGCKKKVLAGRFSSIGLRGMEE
jgi:ferredoxin